MDWSSDAGVNRWRARFDKPDPQGVRWECVVEPRGGTLDSLLASGHEGLMEGATGGLTPGDGPWLWALGHTDASGKFRLGGCGAVATREEAMAEAEQVADSLLDLMRDETRRN
jgi:hypothetical protein